jgi:hypothetical protein
MVRPVEQIEQELATLDQAVGAIAQEFYDAYQQYLETLGKAIRQQLILASYHICTRGYPESFLKLSLQQRQELQQSLQQLGRQAQKHLLERLQPVGTPELPSASLSHKGIEALLAKALSGVETELTFEESNPLQAEQTRQESDPEGANAIEPFLPSDGSDFDGSPSYGIEPDEFSDESLDEPLDESLDELSEESSSELMASDPDRTPTDQDHNLIQQPALLPLTPKVLAQWQERMEQQIVEELQELSHTANRQLQQAEVLPKRLPDPVLEVASKADLASETTASPPNLLNLLIESGSEEETTMTQVTTIRLRLSEIEFSDAKVAVSRSKIRSLMAQLTKLGREYQKAQKEKAIAQAEAAWRSSWYEG